MGSRADLEHPFLCVVEAVVTPEPLNHTIIAPKPLKPLIPLLTTSLPSQQRQEVNVSLFIEDVCTRQLGKVRLEPRCPGGEAFSLSPSQVAC